MRLARWGLLIGVLVLAGCADGCVCTNIAKSATQQPSPDQVQRELQRRLAKDKAVASTLCGVAVVGLSEVEVEVAPETLGFPRAKVRGNAVEMAGAEPTADPMADGSRDASADGPRDASGDGPRDASGDGPRDASGDGPRLVLASKGKALACAGVVSVVALAVFNGDGTVKEWQFNAIEVEEVTTPGVTMKKPTRRRRHHHG